MFLVPFSPRGLGLRPMSGLWAERRLGALWPLRIAGAGSLAMNGRRQKRDVRRAGVKILLTKRDEALLRALARFRIATSEDLRRLFFSDVRRDTAMARLRKLYDADFLAVRPGGLSRPNLYTVGPAGIAWAESAGVAVARSPAQPFEHHLAIVRLWTELAAAIHARDGLRLTRFEPDWELRRRFAGSGGPIVPDAAIEIAHARGTARIALEVDLTTERLSALQRKLSRYDPSGYFTSPQSIGLAVVVSGAGERRKRSVEDLVTRSWMGWSVTCTEQEWPAMLLNRITEAPLDESPAGKGRTERATSSVEARTREQGEGPSQ